jgi:hypothetical protein
MKFKSLDTVKPRQVSISRPFSIDHIMEDHFLLKLVVRNRSTIPALRGLVIEGYLCEFGECYRVQWPKEETVIFGRMLERAKFSD